MSFLPTLFAAGVGARRPDAALLLLGWSATRNPPAPPPRVGVQELRAEPIAGGPVLVLVPRLHAEERGELGHDAVRCALAGLDGGLLLHLCGHAGSIAAGPGAPRPPEGGGGVESARSSQEVQLTGAQDRLDAAVHAELRVDVDEVRLHRGLSSTNSASPMAALERPAASRCSNLDLRPVSGSTDRIGSDEIRRTADRPAPGGR